MRILIVSQHFWPESFQINDIVRSLGEKDVKVDILTGKPNYPEGKYYPGYNGIGCRREQFAGAEVFRVPLVARGKRSAIRLALNYLSFVICASVFGPWLLRGRRYDAIFVYAVSPLLQAIPALLLGVLKRAKVIVWIQDLWPDSLVATGYIRNRAVLKGVEWIVKFIYRHTDLLLVQSEAFKGKVKKLAPVTPIVYYPNSVAPIFSSEAEIVLPELPLPDGVFSIVFAGNVGAAQAVEVIVAAAELLREHAGIAFVVFGTGSRWEWMQEEVARLGLRNLHLLGRFPVEMMPGVMRKASALLVTLADEPIFAATIPNKIQAYMAVGRPILACMNGEGARLVEEANAGLAVPAQDGRALADAVVKLFKMTQLERAELGVNGKRYFEANFNQDRLIDQLIEHFRAASATDRDR